MNWEDAEMKLKGKPDGSFLVRDSSDPRYILSLSFRSQGVTHHTRMEHYRGEEHTHTPQTLIPPSSHIFSGFELTQLDHVRSYPGDSGSSEPS